MKLNIERIDVIQNKHPIEILAYQYPQLYLPIQEGISKSLLYRKIVQKGYRYTSDNLDFAMEDEDELFLLTSPYGRILGVYLSDRQDFENFVRVMRYRCEPIEIPKSMGAVMISGISNWRKIESYKNQYLSEGNQDWAFEFKRFTSEKKNYQDEIIVISRGGYSGIDYSSTEYSIYQWENISKNIRIGHEYTHYMCKTIFSEKKNIILEEIIADCMGLLYAVGEYNVTLAKKFLGIEGENYKCGGRLENYVSHSPYEIAIEASKMVEILSKKVTDINIKDMDYLEILQTIY